MQLSDVESPDWDALMDKLWETRQMHDRFRGYYTARFCRPEKVCLSQDGWEQIERIIVERGICVEVTNCCMGFTCGLILWKDREEPYPGTEIGPSVIFDMCSHMLPGDDRSGFKEGWDEFEPLFTSKENIERLKWNKRLMPKDACHYDY